MNIKDTARLDMLKLEAMKTLLTNKNFACEITVSGLKISVSNNTKVISVIDNEIKEIEKFLNNKPNSYE